MRSAARQTLDVQNHIGDPRAQVAIHAPPNGIQFRTLAAMAEAVDEDLKIAERLRRMAEGWFG